ncbi:MAG: hypothetical protein WBZ31_08720 [Thiobacillus sp.]
MRLFRLVLMLVLSVAIPLHGFAAVPPCACPMQTQGEVPIMAAAPSPEMADCCKHSDSRPPSDKPCKCGQSCGVNGIFLALPAALNFPVLASCVTQPHTRSPLFVGQAASIWHPPRLL